MLKSEYLHVIADRFSVTEEVAEAQLTHEKRGVRPDTGHKPFTPGHYSKKPPEIDSLEEKVLRLVIKHPALVECVRESDALGCFEGSGFCAIAGALQALPAETGRRAVRFQPTICCGSRICRNSTRDFFWNPLNSMSPRFNCATGLEL